MIPIQVIKFVESSTTPAERIITPVDRGILELKTAIHNLQSQVDSVQCKIDECETPLVPLPASDTIYIQVYHKGRERSTTEAHTVCTK